VSDSEEIVLPFPAPVQALGLTTHVSGTLLASSMQALRAKGWFDRYAALLPTAYRDQVLGSVVGEWLPIDCGRAHYEACEALDLTTEEQTAMGRDVSRHVNESFLGFVVKMARAAGVTPWLVLPRSNALYQRVLRGGGSQVVKLGPKEATIEIVGVTLLNIPYFRQAMLGMYEAGVALFAERVHIRSVPLGTTPITERFLMRVRWV
jgi:hypothetical protein